MADVVQFPDQSPQPDAEFTYTDEHGVRWGKYLCEYQFDGARWSVELWARSFEDAQARIGSVGCTGVVKGRIYTQVDASNVTMEGLARAGAEIAQPEERPICNGEDAGSTPAHCRGWRKVKQAKLPRNKRRTFRLRYGETAFTGPRLTALRAMLRREAFIRQSGICHWCKKPMHPKADKQRPDSVTLEHLKPLTAGGEDTFDNTVAACRRCNNERGDDDACEHGRVIACAQCAEEAKVTIEPSRSGDDGAR